MSILLYIYNIYIYTLIKKSEFQQHLKAAFGIYIRHLKPATSLFSHYLSNKEYACKKQTNKRHAIVILSKLNELKTNLCLVFCFALLSHQDICLAYIRCYVARQRINIAKFGFVHKPPREFC